MLTSKRGSPDGLEIREYEAGKKYDLPARLAGIFLSQGWAEEDKELVLEVKIEAPAEVPQRTKKRRR